MDGEFINGVIITYILMFGFFDLKLFIIESKKAWERIKEIQDGKFVIRFNDYFFYACRKSKLKK